MALLWEIEVIEKWFFDLLHEKKNGGSQSVHEESNHFPLREEHDASLREDERQWRMASGKVRECAPAVVVRVE